MTSSRDGFQKTAWRQLVWIVTEQFSRSPGRAADPLILAQVVGLARFSITNLYKSALICSIPVLMMVVAACGGSSQDGVTDEPTSARVIVIGVQVSSDGQRVESITIRTDEGKDLQMRLGKNIDPAMWEPLHLQSHQGLGESLGLKIGVTYMQTPEGIVATALSE